MTTLQLRSSLEQRNHQGYGSTRQQNGPLTTHIHTTHKGEYYGNYTL